MEQLKQLGELHTAGVLSDEEFAAAKAKLLALGADQPWRRSRRPQLEPTREERRSNKVKNPPILISVLGFFGAMAGFAWLFFGLRLIGFDWFGIFGDLPAVE